MHAWRAASAASMVCAAAACGLFPDVSYLSEGDAATDASLPDAPHDGSVDASKPNDAPTEALTEAQTSVCDTPHTFCDDFDGPFGQKWDDSEVQSGPLVASTNSVSGFALEATANSNGETSALYKHFNGKNHTHIEFDALVQEPADTSNDEVDLIDLNLDDAPDPYTFAVLDMMRYQEVSQIEQYLDNADASTGQDLPFTEEFLSWHHLALDLDFAKQTFVASVDGSVVQTLDLSPALGESGFTLYLGVGYAATNDPWMIFIDNFVLDQN